jgi:hypothetical protein
MPLSPARAFAPLAPFILIPLLGGCGARPATSAAKEHWNNANDPRLLAGDYVVKLDALPHDAETTLKPWSDTYWPSFKGGLAYRWNAFAGGDGFSYDLLTKDDVQAMSEGQLRQLSPAEKYDILLGRWGPRSTSRSRSR